SFLAQLAHPLETVTSFLSHDAFSVSSLRSWTIHLLNGKSINRLHSIYSTLSQSKFAINSNRNSTVSGGFISKQSNGTDGASSAEPIKRTGQSGVSSAVPIKHYHPLRCQACFLKHK
ncbi:unnamed protein product, partial [Brassica oleracea]